MWVAGGRTIAKHKPGISSLGLAGGGSAYFIAVSQHRPHDQKTYNLHIACHKQARSAFITISIANVRYNDNATTYRSEGKGERNLFAGRTAKTRWERVPRV